ncbi:glycosyltransferase family 2 protein [Candidatus Bathyarchaeota archaeon]|nr:glycosyltransferase family 2 protein [Candidatus Bathyarchaeota archaeon]
MAPKISVFIPVYHESEFLEPLLSRLLEDPYDEKEIFVIVDEPTEKSLCLANRFSGKTRFVFNGVRKGKVNALNEVVAQSTGEILFFLDSDTMLDSGLEALFRQISKEIEDAEIVEVKKDIIRDSFIAKIVSYDYLGFNFTNWLFSKKLSRCLGLNGAAFAVKRETFKILGGFRKVIMEDLDIGTRSFINGVRYKFVRNIRVYTKAPSSWSSWFKQRKRWALGSALWFKEYFKDLVRMAKSHPSVLLPALFFIFPCLPFFLFTLFIPDEIFLKTFYFSLLLLSTQTTLLLAPTAFTSTSLAILRNLAFMVGNIGAYSSFFYFLSRKMGNSFNLLEFVIFFLIYSPLWFLMIITNLSRVCLKQKTGAIDWKL